MHRSHLAALGLVALGGAAGAALRESILLAPTGVEHPHASVLAINTVGAFVLGVLYQTLGAGGSARHRRTRLLLGPGLCGGFTTYSAFTVQAAELAEGGDHAQAMAFALLTVVAGAVAVLVGMLVAARFGGRPKAEVDA